MYWNKVDVQEQRIRFAVAAERREHSFGELCEEFGISRSAGYKWWRRYQAEGVAGLAPRSRRPHNSPQRTPPAIEQKVIELRRRTPDWGARKLHVRLAQQGIPVPVITIHRILLRQGLVAVEDRQRPALQRFEREQPNKLWQMDFKGLPTAWQTVGQTPLSVLDDHSRYLLNLWAPKRTTGHSVRETLEETFGRCGLPQQMLMDHGSPWWNMQGAGWTRLSVWLMQQGIELRFSGYRHPQTQGKVERFHGSLHRALKRRGLPPHHEDWQNWLDAFREQYNHERPHEALHMQTPVSRWRPSERRFDPEPRRWQYPPGSWVRRVGVNGGLWLNNKRWEVSRALAEQEVALEQVGETILVRYCRTTVREIDLCRGRSIPVDITLNDFVWPHLPEPEGPS